LGRGGLPTWHEFIWITLAMLGARTLAMSLNRVIDREIDRRNPRTAGRPIPSGRISTRSVVLVSVASGVLLFVSAWELNDLAVKLFPIALVFLVGYHFTKRFTWLSHAVLGLTDGAAPVGGWVAVTGRLDPPAILLGLAVALWVGGFDLIYACQDVEFDRANGLHSVPARFGVPTAVWMARAWHAGTIACLAAVGATLGLGVLFWIGWTVAALLLAFEHAIVTPTDLSRLDVAFFNVNGYLAVVVFGFTFVSVLMRSG
ncbi:MAG: 4-hydroxybenzoate polyprenyltransferase, partial [Chloroflexota bacterium]|nr:4-hydroxybenzoate polyprenyltransferase [Chloroflexota bacterium]